jgi:YbbR domain-containing protein
LRLNLTQYKTKIQRFWQWLIGKDFLIFLMFVGLVTIFWWGHTMTSTREMTIQVALQYSGVDDRYVFSTPLPTQLSVAVRDNGRELRQISQQHLSITIDLTNLITSNEGILELNSKILRPQLQEILPGSTIILHTFPEQHTSSYLCEASRLLPIKLQTNITTAPQYQLIGSAHLSTDSVNVYGPRDLLGTVDAILTDSIICHGIRDSISKLARVIVPEGLRCATKEIEVMYYAEQFTEKSFTLPIEVKNKPEGKNIQLFPMEITAIVRIGVTQFADLDITDLHATCNYPQNNEDILPVMVESNNPHATNIRFYPNSIEYVIH